LPNGGNYVVDFFRVQGGKTHQYGLNCNGKFLGLERAAVSPVNEEIPWLQNLRAADKLPHSWCATWEYDGVKFRLSMPTEIDRLVVADAPGWRSYRGDQLHAPPITQILAERTGREPLRSVYAAVLCPFRDAAPPIRAVRLVTAQPREDAIAVAIDREGQTDYVLSALDDRPRTYGPIHMAGRFGMATLDSAGRLVRALLLEGTELACGPHVVRAAEARAVRKIVSVGANRVELDRPLPAALGQSTCYVRSVQTAFEIEKVEGRWITFREYPFEGGEEIVAASKTWFDRKP
jgi:hypothetical protein